MHDFKGKRYWIVGATEGLGRAVAERLSALGADLVLSARNRARLTALAVALPGVAEVVTMDVADDDSVAQAARQVGAVDGLVFLAGVYWPMSATEWDTDRAAAMIDVNVTGAMRILGRVVPGMVARGTGHVVLTGSLTAFRGLPGSIGYTASKAAIMSLAECMRADLGGTGVRVQLVNPGFIRTRLTDQNAFTMPFIMEPDAAARIYVAHMTTNRFQRHFPRAFSWMFRVGRILPDSLYFRFFPTRTVN